MEDQVAVIAQYAADMQRFHLSEARELDGERLQGIQVYVGAIAVLTGFVLTRAKAKAWQGLYRVAVALATLIVLMFQLYWNQYARESEYWAQEYAGEFLEVFERLKANDADRPPTAVFNKVPCKTSGKTVAWRVRKHNEIRQKWLQQKAKKNAPVSCTFIGKASDVFKPSRQFNMWSAGLFIFAGLAFALSFRLGR
jgi:hypothetical protein